MKHQHGPLETAVRFLSQRDYSEKQLKEKLRQKGFSGDEIEDSVAEMKRQGYLNDQRFLNHHIEKLLAEKRHGFFALREKLRSLGFDQISAGDLRRIYPEEMEWTTACTLLNKRFSTPYSEEIPRLARFLGNRGFSPEIISKLAREYRNHQQ